MKARYLDSTAPTWVLIETVAAAAFALVSMLVVSREIGPAASGIGAIAIAVFLLADLVGTMLLSDTVIQHRGLARRHADSAATASILAACLMACIVAAIAPLAAAATGQPMIRNLLLVLAPLLPLSAFSAIVAGLVLRAHRHRLLAMRVLVCQPVGLLLGLAAARAGAGAWAMVAVQAGCTVPVTLLLLTQSGCRVRPLLDRAALREMWPVAGPQFVAEVMRSGRYRVFIMMLGALSAPSVVAVCNVGFRLLDQALAVVTGSSSRITLPRLARLDDRHALAETFGELAQLQAMLGWPVATGIALIAPDMIQALMGPEWAGAAVATRIAALAALASFSFGDAGSLWVAVGKTRMNFWTSAAGLAIPIVAVAVVRPETPEAAAYCWGAAAVIPALVVAWLVLRELRRSPVWLLRRLAPAAIAAGMMAAAVAVARPILPHGTVLSLLCQAALGASVFAVVAWMALGRRLPGALLARPELHQTELHQTELHHPEPHHPEPVTSELAGPELASPELAR